MADLKISTPRGFVADDGNGKITLNWNPGFGPEMTANLNKAQAFVDSECLRLCAPLVPMRTSMLLKSGTLGTVIGSGEVQYIAPYARVNYYENRGTGARGKLWFKRMAAAHRKQILAGAKRLAGAK